MKAISLIGFSGIGKSFWSLQFERIGFERICCDDLVERELAKYLKRYSQAGIKTVAAWMGQPYSSGYKEREKKYIRAEKVVMQKIIRKLSGNRRSLAVLDTTGSVIYTGVPVCQSLQRVSQVVYIQPSAQATQQMFERYILDPKPVIWGNQFKQKPGQTDLQALTTCYPRLLKYRAQQYKKYAEVILPYESTSQINFTILDFLHAVLQYK
ncbi:MAG: hypothetical protein ACD_43C00138G0001 [uncultured bacterium]|nr:MAG: hypothetical protein ACD_43C00138G0001 [uncultured bacterium]